MLKDALAHHQAIDVSSLRSVQLVRRFFPVSETYHGTAMTIRRDGVLTLTPMALVIVAILGTDIVFAIDSVPAVYGITGDPYLVFATNAFALLGLRALYFVLEGALSALAHLGYGLAAILAFIGVKLVLHWAHKVWPARRTGGADPALAGGHRGHPRPGHHDQPARETAGGCGGAVVGGVNIRPEVALGAVAVTALGRNPR